MNRVVADASILLEYLLGTPSGAGVAAVLEDSGSVVHVPALCDVEVVAGLRRALGRRLLDVDRAREAVIDYLDLNLVRHGHQKLIVRSLELRANFSAYDATYVALAEGLGAQLLTADARLAHATRAHTSVAVAG